MWNRKHDRKKNLLPFVTDEQKLLEAVRNSGVTGSPFFFQKKKTWRSFSRQSWSTDKNEKVQQDFGKCPTHAWREQILNKTSYKFEMVTVVSRTQVKINDFATSNLTKRTLVSNCVFWVIFNKISYLHCLKIRGAILYLSFGR